MPWAQVIVEGLKIYGSSWQSTHRDQSFYIGRDKVRRLFSTEHWGGYDWYL